MDILPGSLSPPHAQESGKVPFDALDFLLYAVEPICVLDWEAKYVWTNNAYVNCIGYAPNEILGESLFTFIDPRDLLMSRWEFERMVKGGNSSIAFVHRYRNKKGETVYLQWNAIPRAKEKKVYITCKNISLAREKESAQKRIIENFNLIIRAIDAGVWTHDFQSGKEWWSDNFYKILHYKPEKMLSSFENFSKLIHPEDIDHVKRRFYAHIHEKADYRVEMRLLNGKGEYQWVESRCQSIRDEDGQALRVTGIMRDIHESKQVQIQLEKQEFLLNETAHMVKLGSWELDLNDMKPTWSEEVYRIHEVDLDFPLNIESALNFYPKPYRKPLEEAVNRAIFEGKSYDLELKINTGKGRNIWVRTIGKPVYNDKGIVISLRGTFQDIQMSKLREISLNKSIEIISEQNNRLSNFAYIISHNIRSHLSNFELLYDLHERSTDKGELRKIERMGKLTYDRLKETIEHLSHIIEIQNDIPQQMEMLDIRKVLMRTFDILSMDIKQTRSLIDLDISSWYRMKGVLAYIESIFLNLTSNAIKYRHPDRALHLRIKTYVEEDRLIMTFQDNGLGIDLVQNSEALFGMYKTFHDHPQAKGIGLFISKNQMEAMGGNIKVKSKVNVGTTFILTFRNFD